MVARHVFFPTIYYRRGKYNGEIVSRHMAVGLALHCCALGIHNLARCHDILCSCAHVLPDLETTNRWWQKYIF